MTLAILIVYEFFQPDIELKSFRRTLKLLLNSFIQHITKNFSNKTTLQYLQQTQNILRLEFWHLLSISIHLIWRMLLAIIRCNTEFYHFKIRFIIE